MYRNANIILKEGAKTILLKDAASQQSERAKVVEIDK